jgi:hypothetical protein
MDRLNYWQLPGLENIYLEDSYVLGIKTDTSIEFFLEAILTENHPLYTSPLPGEQYCYRSITLKFPHPQTYNLTLNKMLPIVDPDGTWDYGNIDEFFLENQTYHLIGEWGELTIVSDSPIIEFDSNFSITNSDFLQKTISFEKIKDIYSTLIDENVKSLSINFSVLAMR